MAGIFKAYDVRGTYPDQIDEAKARAIGQAFQQLVADDPGPVVVSRDMRSHSVPMCEALTDGLRAAGLDVIDIGLATTPMNYFAVGHLEAAGGIQVTASHNPARYNGMKSEVTFSSSSGMPWSPETGRAPRRLNFMPL